MIHERLQQQQRKCSRAGQQHHRHTYTAPICRAYTKASRTTTASICSYVHQYLCIWHCTIHNIHENSVLYYLDVCKTTCVCCLMMLFIVMFARCIAEDQNCHSFRACRNDQQIQQPIGSSIHLHLEKRDTSASCNKMRFGLCTHHIIYTAIHSLFSTLLHGFDVLLLTAQVLLLLLPYVYLKSYHSICCSGGNLSTILSTLRCNSIGSIYHSGIS
jgi:hypothetical protein